MKVAVFDSKSYDIKSLTSTNDSFGNSLKFFDEHLTLDNVILTKGFDVVCVFVNDIVTKEMIDYMYENGVKMIALRCAGFNNVDFESAFGKIHIARVPSYSPYAVAEHAVALIMTLNRKIHKSYSRTRDANFSLNGLLGFDMYNKTAGVIGTGKIAQILIKILKGFEMKVIAYDPFPNEEAAKNLGFKYTSLDNLYKESDIISLHCPLTKDTEYLINEDSIAKMKDGVMIVNTGRGKLINTKDLITGLKNQKIGSAGLDVYEEESDYFFEDKSDIVLDDDVLARLLTFSNVIVTSHQAFFTREALQNIAFTTLSNIKDFEDGKELKNEICYRCYKTGGVCTRHETKKCF